MKTQAGQDQSQGQSQGQSPKNGAASRLLSGADVKAARLKAALKANLARRKEQARKRKSDAQGGSQ